MEHGSFTIFIPSTPVACLMAADFEVIKKHYESLPAKLEKAREIIGRDLIERHGGRVVRIPLAKGRSTSRLVARLRARR